MRSDAGRAHDQATLAIRQREANAAHQQPTPVGSIYEAVLENYRCTILRNNARTGVEASDSVRDPTGLLAGVCLKFLHDLKNLHNSICVSLCLNDIEAGLRDHEEGCQLLDNLHVHKEEEFPVWFLFV